MSSLDGARMLGSYQLLSQLAVGGMAEIYVARTHGVGGFEKLVALKVIHPNFSADPDFVRMLVDEAKLSVQLTHGNIVQTFDLGHVDEQYYIAMELIDGVDLYKLLRRASEHAIDFPFEVAAFVAAEVCSGLDYAHRKRDARGRPLQIVHRDVSPQNVLVTYDGEVKIVDFGIAKAALRGQQTAAGVIKGKYFYMSPEQAWGDPIDARTDIFSAGILLYEMIAGQMLYLEEDLEKLLDVVRKANIAPPSARRPGVPRELEAIVMRALKKRAEERWATAGELAQALQQFLRGFQPEFSRVRLAAFVKEVMGEEQTARRRDPRMATAHAARVPVEVHDENSLIFKLQDLKPVADKPPGGGGPRRADVPTSVRGGSDFDNDATLVDTGDTLLARMAGDLEATGPASVTAPRRTAATPSGTFDLGADDPAVDAALEVSELGPRLSDDDDDAPTSTLPLPARPRTPPPLDDPAPEEIIDAPASLPGIAMPPPAHEKRPTPLSVRARHPNAPRVTPAVGPTQPLTAEPTAPTPQPNAPAAELDPVDTRQRTRRTSEPRRIPTPVAPVSFADDTGPEPTVSARPRTQTAAAAAAAAAPPSAAPAPPPPAAQPPAIDSEEVAVAPFASPLGEPEPRPPARVWRGFGIALAILAILGVGGAAAYTLAGAGDARGTLSIVSLPPGAEVCVDGNSDTRETPVTLSDVDRRQTHHVRVSKGGYDVWESDVKFPPLEREVRVQAVLMPAVGTLEITSTPPGAEAIVNGRIRGMTPATVGDLPPNDDVVIELRLRGYKVAHKTVSWAAKRTLNVSIPLEKAK